MLASASGLAAAASMRSPAVMQRQTLCTSESASMPPRLPCMTHVAVASTSPRCPMPSGMRQSMRASLHTGPSFDHSKSMETDARKLRAARQPAVSQLAAPAIALPNYCSGCGIRLQRTDPDAPGYFIVPAKLLQRSTQPERLTLPDEDTLDPKEAHQRQLDAEVEDKLLGPQATHPDGDPEGPDEQDLPEVLCQRCHSLKHRRSIASPIAESSLPGFDFAKKVGRKIFLQKDRRAVVLCVVDGCDFDGSFPREAIRSLYPPGSVESWQADDGQTHYKASREVASKMKVVVAVTKKDLMLDDNKGVGMPSLTTWVQNRVRSAQLPKADKVFLVSAVTGQGVRDMVLTLKDMLGYRGDLWVIGSQNAGKSSLIAAMKRTAGHDNDKRNPTVAPMPGTTLGLINVPGVPLGRGHRVFDTPGVHHAHSMQAVLNFDELKEVLPSRALRPRTYRIGAGHSLLIGGLVRIDILDVPGATLYLTVYVSHKINLHMGKTEGVEERLKRHVGVMLRPPDSLARLRELPAWQPRDVAVYGGPRWDEASVAIAIAGLGFVTIGVVRQARFRVWTFPNVAVTTHGALLWKYAEKKFETPGFSTQLPHASLPGKQAEKLREVLESGEGPRPVGSFHDPWYGEGYEHKAERRMLQKVMKERREEQRQGKARPDPGADADAPGGRGQRSGSGARSRDRGSWDD